MAHALPRSPSFVSLSTALPDSPDLDDAPPTPKVRFEQECVLIPDVIPFSRLPRLVTKSYSLPLWKRKRSPSVVSEPEEELPEDHVVFKVSVPSITTKARSPSREAAARPLVSCLVHNPDPSSSFVPTSPPRPIGRLRRGSLPVPIPAEAETVPLRACCAQCYHSIDKCMKEGDHWQVHFSRGALRRRKSVSDAHAPARARHCVREAMPGFDAIVAVDEVDQRRKSTELDALTAFTIEMPTNACVSTSTGPEEIPLRRALSLPDAVHPNRAKLMPDLHPRALSPSIIEEDEFRPSPRRTPIPSPLGSSTNLPSTRVLVAPPVEKAVAIPIPAARSSSPENVFANLASVLSSSPVALTPPLPGPVQEKADCTSYFPAPYHERADSLDSSLSSPSSSPRIPHARSTSTLESPGARRKPLMALPGSIVRVSAQMLKGLSGMGGMPV